MSEQEWNDSANKIYDETYNRVYRQAMAGRPEDRPRPWYEEEAQELAITMAEDAVKEYLSLLTRPHIDKEEV
jgi:hypothetical protein